MSGSLNLPITAPKTLTILGCTGSIGQNALGLIRQRPERFSIMALTAHANVAELIALAKEFRPDLAVIGQAEHYNELKAALSGTGIKTAAGAEALIEAAQIPSDVVLAAIVGAAGLAPTLAAIRRGAHIALANKEALVCAGELVMREAKRCGAQIIPVDSEHSAIFQLFDFDKPETVEKIILTASGGPFREFTREQMKCVTPEQAVKHPNWSMGAKISVDSATMMNKGLEIIEAFHLFPLSAGQIEIVVHPESIIHGMVAYKDGSVLAQMGTPDMVTPIAYALAHPERISTHTARLDWTKLTKLTFEQPDHESFPAISLAREALKTGGSAPCIMNAANEIAVDAFLKGRIGFLEICDKIGGTLEKMQHSTANTLEEILAIDNEARKITMQ